MGITAGMKDIVQDIVSSRDARAAEVKGLKEEAIEMLGSFQASHKKMGDQLRRELADDKAKMGAEVEAMRSGFQSSRKEMSSVLKKDLAEHTQAVRGEVVRLRQGMGASHQDMSAKLRKNLAQGAAVRKSEAHVMLNDFQRAHNQMGTQLRKELADNDRGIKSEVAGMRQETKADLGGARTAWQKLTRGVKKAAVKATPEAVKAEVAKAAPVEEETPDLKAKLLAAIAEHPEGITLTEVAESLGVAPIVFGRAAKRLVDEGRVRKEDKAYFPMGAE
ncbi:MAG: hypothetical protein Q8O55_06690 [Dehalococcoidales bacterium]|nr:hypothetical protein [Dehalococcoidales bacterium]